MFCKAVPPIVLASKSPRRIDILRHLGLTFGQETSPVPEDGPAEGEPPRDYTLRLARAKALAVAPRHAASIVIAADTEVAVGDRILGKPIDEEGAVTMLRLLSGRWHQVVTSLCLLDTRADHVLTSTASTDVLFCELAEEEIAGYVASREPMGKAGAYAIQGKAALFVREIRGCYFNVVGFPVNLFYGLWKELDLPTDLFFRSGRL